MNLQANRLQIIKTAFERLSDGAIFISTPNNPHFFNQQCDRLRQRTYPLSLLEALVKTGSFRKINQNHKSFLPHNLITNVLTENQRLKEKIQALDPKNYSASL